MFRESEGENTQDLTFVLMPFLSGSHREWNEVRALLEPRWPCIGIDLPGFGDAADVPGYSVEEMAGYVEARVGGLTRFVLAGHSMAGKVATVLAARGVPGLAGLVLVASSPPAPEPMSETRRQKMIADLGSRGPSFRAHAEEFIRSNVDGELPPQIFERAVEDVLRMNCAAWTAWLESGSREDWSERVGVLPLPALVLAGAADKDLGEDAQRELVLPHFENPKLLVVNGAAHLLPMERPRELAKAMTQFAESLEPAAEFTRYGEFLQSPRVSDVTRAVLRERTQPVSEASWSAVFSVREMQLLRAVAGTVIPQQGTDINLAGALAKRLAAGEGKGWRYDVLPESSAAYHAALAVLDSEAQRRFGKPFDELSGGDRHVLLAAAQAGELAADAAKQDSVLLTSVPALNAAQMQRWFEDCRGDLVGIYMSHPQTLALIGFSGIGDGADSSALTGFVQLGIGAVEDWEPRAAKVGA